MTLLPKIDVLTAEAAIDFLRFRERLRLVDTSADPHLASEVAVLQFEAAMREIADKARSQIRDSFKEKGKKTDEASAAIPGDR